MVDLLRGYVASEVCFTIVDKENVPVGMFGVSKEVLSGY